VIGTSADAPRQTKEIVYTKPTIDLSPYINVQLSRIGWMVRKVLEGHHLLALPSGTRIFTGGVPFGCGRAAYNSWGGGVGAVGEDFIQVTSKDIKIWAGKVSKIHFVPRRELQLGGRTWRNVCGGENWLCITRDGFGRQEVPIQNRA